MTDKNSKIVNIRDAVAERVRQEEESDKQSKPDTTPDSDFVIKCLRKNELGDGELFKKLYSDRFVFNNATDSWMEWNGHQWIMDSMNNASASVEGVVRLYEHEAIRLSKEIGKMETENIEPSKGRTKPSDPLSELRKELNNRINNLRTVAKRQNCLTFAHTSENPLSIKGDEIDKKPWMLPCKNGVINLITGELENGRHKDFLLKSSPVSWLGIEEPCPIWEKTLLEIFSGNQEIVDCFQRVCGYAMIGKVLQSLLIVMTGKGRNGKTLLVETISKTLGPLACAIRSEMLLDQNRVANPSGPSPDIMSLRGLRMAFASETDDGCKISPSRVKWLTGNDTITGRNPHDKHDVSFKPSHTLFLLTNHKPHAPAEDFAFWERMILFPFDLSYVDRTPKANSDERRADSKLPEKLEDELSGILAWMVRGCLAWQVMGVSPPQAIRDAVTGYQREEDSIADFIEECCIIGERYSVGASEVYSVFEKWWVINVSKNVPKQKRFGMWFAKRFEREKKQTVRYLGVALLDPSNVQSKF